MRVIIMFLIELIYIQSILHYWDTLYSFLY